MDIDVPTAIATLEQEGLRLAAAAERAGLDADVPTCPGWTVADLVAHTSGVHRWAATHVREVRTDPIGDDEEADIMRPPPEREELLAWFRTGHRDLVDALRAAPDDLECWTFMPAPSPRAFWARRQAHETTIHRVDAERAGGPAADVTAVAAAVAADGIDELVTRFLVRPKAKLRSDPARVLAAETTDTGDRWVVTIGPDRVTTERVATKQAGDAQGEQASPVPADCTVRGPAHELYLLLWNRVGAHEAGRIEVEGDRALLDRWAGGANVRW